MSPKGRICRWINLGVRGVDPNWLSLGSAPLQIPPDYSPRCFYAWSRYQIYPQFEELQNIIREAINL